MTILTQILPLLLALFVSKTISASDFLNQVFGECLYADLLMRCDNHLLVKLANHLDFSPLEKACTSYRHCCGPGTQTFYPVSILTRCLLVGYLYNLSLRQLEQRLHSDLIVRWFVGLPAFGDVPTYSTLERFEQWVCKHQRRIYQDSLLKQIDDFFPQSRKLNQIGDTYAMIANAAEEELISRLRHTADCLLREAKQLKPDHLRLSLAGYAWLNLLGAPNDKQAYLLTKKERQQRIEEVVLAAQELHQRFCISLQAFPSQDFPEIRLWVSYLGKIIHDEVTILDKADAQGNRVLLRSTKERRNDPDTSLRIGSATDPEATYRMHGSEEDDIKFGYNIQVAVALDGFVRETQAYTGAVSDQASIAALIEAQVEHLGCCPPKIIYDQAAGSGKARADVDKASDGQTQLVSRLLPYDKNSKRFGPYDFFLSEDGKILTCPAGKQSTTAYPSGAGDGSVFRFFARQCWLNADPPTRMKDADLSLRCPLWDKCRDKRQGPGTMRQVFVSDYR
ncbi:MAG: transposase, partial [Burkholderiaceae bacterium]|nr:transposase [Burkholderiaceae bacterium]